MCVTTRSVNFTCVLNYTHLHCSTQLTHTVYKYYTQITCILHMCRSVLLVRGFNRRRPPAIDLGVLHSNPPPSWRDLYPANTERKLAFQVVTFLSNTCWKTLEMPFPSVWISKFSGGACPQTPLEARTFGARSTSCLHLLPSLLLQNLLKALLVYLKTHWTECFVCH